MRFGLRYVNRGRYAQPEMVEALADAAERLGFESLWTVEHVVVPAGHVSRYPYAPDGRFPDEPSSPIPDPIVWLTWLAARTSRVRLATGVLVLPQRNPCILAKELATVDVLSGGRVILGVGAGWLREEFEALGVPFEQRGARMEEYVAAMRVLWGDSVPTYHGSTVSFDAAMSFPKPLARTIPVVVGGHSRNAAERAGRIGDGFFPTPPDGLEQRLEWMRAAAVAAGRDPAAIEVTVGGTPSRHWRRHLERNDIDRWVLAPPDAVPDSMEKALAQLLDDVS